MSLLELPHGAIFTLVVAVFVIFPSSGYQYPSSGYVSGGRVYRYVTSGPSVDPWAYSGQSNGAASNPGYGGNSQASRFRGPSPPSASTSQGYPGVVKNRRRNYGEAEPTAYNDPQSSVPTGSTRWYSNLKRKSPTSGLKLDQHNRVQMGVSNRFCDDAKTNLTVDWDLSPVNYTCFHPDTRFPRSFDAQPLLECESLPPRYVPNHLCMDQTLEYKDLIPTHGDHRPLWPKFGEYMFVPRERWLHNIEHGAVVMLYHPCAYPSEVNRLRTMVRGCIGKHVITPSTYLPPERPLALVAWGCRLLMSAVDDDAVMNFIQTRGHKGPEGDYTKEGQYDLGLIRSAKTIGNGAKYGYSKISCDAIDRSRL